MDYQKEVVPFLKTYNTNFLSINKLQVHNTL
nr:MAG TPA: hypothetical protein [Caudoviricetes sp.]